VQNFKPDSLKGWLKENWLPTLGYEQIFHVLTKRWLCFLMRDEGDANKILCWNRKWGPSRLILQKWYVNFNPRHEPCNLQKVWVIMPGLPLEFWQEEMLKSIGNKIGAFAGLEQNWEKKTDRRWAWVQVEKDLKQGLLE
jgi:hypothetical protein